MTSSTDSDIVRSTPVEDGNSEAAPRLANTYAKTVRAVQQGSGRDRSHRRGLMKRRITSLAGHGWDRPAPLRNAHPAGSRAANRRKLTGGQCWEPAHASGRRGVSPRPSGNAILGFLFGGVVGLALAFLAEALDRQGARRARDRRGAGYPLSRSDTSTIARASRRRTTSPSPKELTGS